MRNRRMSRILTRSGAWLVLLPMSGLAAGALRAELNDSAQKAPAGGAVDAFPAPTPVASMPGSLAEDRLEAQARHVAANAVAARAERQTTGRRALRQRVSREGARTRPSRTAPPLIVPGAPDDVWARLRRCEAGGDYRRDSGNGYYGAYQFSAATWRSLGYPGLPHQAPPAVQDEAARRLQQRSGWGQWPACSRRIRVR